MAASEQPAPPAHTSKRLIVCCDGTWMNSDNGYVKGGFFGSPGSLQVPSNVTRIARSFKRRCSDGKLQIISYEIGVGTGSNTLDSITGGAFGLGLSERVREVYAYLCANYADGDEIILCGFSRGAFTARSVAGLVSDLGLLTREGIEHFYPIFKDMQSWRRPEPYKDEFPNDPFPDKPKGEDAAEEYRARLEKLGYTRVTQKNGEPIAIKAVCVWDTVGSLGIPKVAWMSKLGITPSNDDTFKWPDTALTGRIEHAFQALALDETRPPFSPAVWERPPGYKTTTDLRQVWFPGSHANIGGGWADQGVANCSLAWMMDQMASVGVEFDDTAVRRVFQESIHYYRNLFKTAPKQKGQKAKPWAAKTIYENNNPLRPWGLGAICKTTSLFYRLAGETRRTPGLYKKHNRATGKDKAEFLHDTNERVHSSVRIRLACKGLDLNDKGVWTAVALSKNWRLKQTSDNIEDPVPQHPSWEPSGADQVPNKLGGSDKKRWVWEYVGNAKTGPTNEKQKIMVEETLGPYERYYVEILGGTPNVFEYADTQSD